MCLTTAIPLMGFHSPYWSHNSVVNLINIRYVVLRNNEAYDQLYAIKHCETDEPVADIICNKGKNKDMTVVITVTNVSNCHVSV